MILFFFARLFGYQFHVSCPHSPTRGKHTVIAQEVSYEGEGRHGGEDGRKASCGTSVWELWQLPKAELGQREKKNPESFPLAPTFLGEELDGGEGERRPWGTGVPKKGLVLTTMEPSWPWYRWNCTMAWKGKSQITSLLRTKNGSVVSESRSRASARGPAGVGGQVAFFLGV